MTICLLGRMASGKTTLAKMLEKSGYKRIITYTTRPIGKDEVDGVDYHFLTDEEFFKLKEEGFFAETKSFTNSNKEVWYYGSSKDSYVDNTVIVLEPIGLKNVLKNMPKTDIFSIYIDVKTIDSYNKSLERKRNKLEEIRRRILADTIDFKDIENYVDIKINNYNFKHSKEEMLNIILNIVRDGITKI